MSKPHIVQCLCGPERHCIVAIAYASDKDVTSEVTEFLKSQVDQMLIAKHLNPWCEICRNPRERWTFEDAALAFDSLAEAEPYLRQLEAEQALMREMFRSKN